MLSEKKLQHVAFGHSTPRDQSAHSIIPPSHLRALREADLCIMVGSQPAAQIASVYADRTKQHSGAPYANIYLAWAEPTGCCMLSGSFPGGSEKGLIKMMPGDGRGSAGNTVA